ncbi:MAG: type I DNA topoisomerase [Candidatus Phytoplasma stylosanthis]|uniref:type I DNA topoisomerase n=1 Tax=Candidatus Phytoplasma stylosanthis TaxID=2798314 RepID=UPI00293A55F0|nr:type I DNA topoisomerase [Candidatus Phytoplasma stylosanthis]MDV3167923.1 type I DNA topoisomerase [Candidatus Phytoplasma stylosanthis]MDV3170758.1 type I DNA topoisomerase [Candidatus Phytoplasma stylosanthis]MDV3173725.1 type I DNA topoisomerase [Candidatus Phytoplasma stylosanthis]MDV3174015.1 type I DNA topoisomerase [Candidatus Phytoplasma stylosanthis]
MKDDNIVIILESPAKAKTISSYLGNNIKVLYSKGHIRNLSFKKTDNLGIDILNNFQPDYQIIEKQKQIVEKIIQKTKNKKVFLATDPDREGEAIAWHLAQVLNLNKNEKNRILFNEITENVVKEAFLNPIKIRESLVESQETRRILDRIIGFKLSSLVRRIKAQSAGRVQSVALKLIVELEEERKKFVPEEYNLIKVYFDGFQADLVVKPKNYKIKSEEAKKIVSCIRNKFFLLKKIKNKKIKKSPSKPFITSTLQQEAFKILSMKASTTMSIAQKLYEGIDIEGERIGLITYMRTDSLRISSEFIKKVEIFIKQTYGEEYLRNFSHEYKKDHNIQDAHEAIRVTDIQKNPESLKKHLNKYELSLYKLIYERTLSSFMADVIFQRTQLFFEVDQYLFLTEGDEIVFEGYYKIFGNLFKNDFLPVLKLNNKYLAQKIEIIKKMTNPPARFTEASLIKKLESLNIGRPSTYALIIEILKKRCYVRIENNKFVCTELGFLNQKLLNTFFSSIINVNYTSQMEKKLDDISSQKVNKLTFLKEFYNEFEKLFLEADKKIKKPEPVITQQKCDLCSNFLIERKSKYGVFLGCSGFPKCKKIMNIKKV